LDSGHVPKSKDLDSSRVPKSEDLDSGHVPKSEDLDSGYVPKDTYYTSKFMLQNLFGKIRDSLKDYPKRVNVQTFLQKEFRDKFQLSFSLAVFQELALAGQFLFLVDGFDEMMSMADKQETVANFKALTRLTFENVQFMIQIEAGRKNKLLMTCRTHYFFSEAQEKEFLQAYYTVLYRNYATKSRYQITRVNVRNFDDAQIEDFIANKKLFEHDADFGEKSWRR
jgi:predicted NACHT family NTPase